MDMILLLILVVLVLEVSSQESHLEYQNSKCATSSHKSIVDRDNNPRTTLTARRYSPTNYYYYGVARRIS